MTEFVEHVAEPADTVPVQSQVPVEVVKTTDPVAPAGSALATRLTVSVLENGWVVGVAFAVIEIVMVCGVTLEPTSSVVVPFELEKMPVGLYCAAMSWLSGNG